MAWFRRVDWLRLVERINNAIGIVKLEELAE